MKIFATGQGAKACTCAKLCSSKKPDCGGTIPKAQRIAKGQGALRPRIGNGSSLMLSSVLFHSILERSAPLATSAIKQLRKSPMDLDVYAWLVHRLFHLSKPSMVSWEQLSNQFGHNYREPRNFRRFFLDSLKRVSAVYPEAKLNIGASGLLLLLPSRTIISGSAPRLPDRSAERKTLRSTVTSLPLRALISSRLPQKYRRKQCITKAGRAGRYISPVFPLTN